MLRGLNKFHAVAIGVAGVLALLLPLNYLHRPMDLMLEFEVRQTVTLIFQVLFYGDLIRKVHQTRAEFLRKIGEVREGLEIVEAR
jgi:hypothetical protein